MVQAAAVILTHGEHESYRTVLSDLLAEGMPAEDICIVHNPVAPADRPLTPSPEVRVIRMPGNDGYAHGMNAGMRYHLERDAQWIWLLTHDVRLRPGTLRTLLAAARQDSRLGAIGPLLVNAGTDTVFSLGGERTSWGWLYNVGHGSALEAGRAAGDPQRGASQRGGSQRPAAVDGVALTPRTWLDGSSIMLRSRALREAGLYDTRMFGYTEDAELCLRLERAGWSVGLVPGAVAEQSAGALSRPGPVAFLLARNGLRYAQAAVGRSALRPMLAMHVRQTGRLLRRAVIGPRRRVALIQCCATWVGVAAFLAGRTGPPPSWLPGRGDMGPAVTRRSRRTRTAADPRSR